MSSIQVDTAILTGFVRQVKRKDGKVAREGSLKSEGMVCSLDVWLAPLVPGTPGGEGGIQRLEAESLLGTWVAG